MCDVIDRVGLRCDVVTTIVDDLHVHGHIYFDRRTSRWRAEMSPD
jgi:hypothetical protein